MPEDYGISGFQREALPILPNPFLLTVRKVKDKTYIRDLGALKQLNTIDQLFKTAIVSLWLPMLDERGELIFRYL
jgi:DNA topoisomerase-3